MARDRDRERTGDDQTPQESKFWGPAENLIFRAVDGTIIPHPGELAEGEADDDADQGGQPTDTPPGNG